MYCDKLNLEKTIKKPSKKRKTRGDILQLGSEPGLGASCIECGVEISTGLLFFFRTVFPNIQFHFLLSDFCWISHKANVCARRVQCPDCKRYFYVLSAALLLEYE